MIMPYNFKLYIFAPGPIDYKWGCMEAPTAGLRKTATVGGISATVGWFVGKLTPGDLNGLLDKTLDGIFEYLHEQGAYASFALIMAVGFGGLAVWAITKLIDGKQAEIDRMAAERDKFQKPFLDHWKSSGPQKRRR